MPGSADDLPPEWRHQHDDLDSTSNILVRSPCFGGGKTRACADLMGSHDPGNTNALVVTCSDPADRWLKHYRTHAAEQPHNLVVIGVGGNSNAVTATWTDGHNTRQLTPGEPVIDAIGDPGDFTGIGIKITEYLHAFEAVRFDDGPNRISCCFDSITALLQYAEPPRVYRFLHALTAWIRDTSATAHYHVDPEAHDGQEIAVLEPLFDALLDATHGTDPDDWTVERP